MLVYSERSINYLLISETCPSLSIPSDGSISYSQALHTNNEYLPGTVASFSCDPGFELVGDETRECQHDSTWGSSQPQCLRE